MKGNGIKSLEVTSQLVNGYVFTVSLKLSALKENQDARIGKNAVMSCDVGMALGVDKNQIQFREILIQHLLNLWPQTDARRAAVAVEVKQNPFFVV